MIQKIFHFNRRYLRPHITPRNTQRFIACGITLYALNYSYSFYEEYAWKHEGLRRMKKQFYDDEDYVVNNSLSILDFFNKNYTTPMINIEPRS
jgi:hypothetical protein